VILSSIKTALSRKIVTGQVTNVFISLLKNLSFFYFRIGNKINTLLNFLGIEAKQFVIKMGQCNIMPVAKISDSK
jgi:hypothetical protein